MVEAFEGVYEALTCMPQTRTPSVLLVVRSHFLRCDFFLAMVASMPYWRVPILRSITQGCFKRPVKSSIRMKWFWRVTDALSPDSGIWASGKDREDGWGRWH